MSVQPTDIRSATADVVCPGLDFSQEELFENLVLAVLVLLVVCILKFCSWFFCGRWCSFTSMSVSLFLWFG